MQPVSHAPNTAKIAFLYGLIGGLLLTVIASAILLVNTFVNANLGFALLSSGLSLLLGLAVYFVVGILASRHTGKVRTGTFAGLWTGAIYGVLAFIVSMTLFFTMNLPRLLAAHPASPAFRAGAVIGGVGFALFGIVCALGLGAGLGALGGLLGKRLSPVAPPLAYPFSSAQTVPPQFPPYMPYSTQPAAEQPYQPLTAMPSVPQSDTDMNNPYA